MQSAVYRLHYNITMFTQIVYVFFMIWPSTLCFVLVKCSKCGPFMLNALIEFVILVISFTNFIDTFVLY